MTTYKHTVVDPTTGHPTHYSFEMNPHEHARNLSTCAVCSKCPPDTPVVVADGASTLTYCTACKPESANVLVSDTPVCPYCDIPTGPTTAIHVHHCPARPMVCPTCAQCVNAATYAAHRAACDRTEKCSTCGLPSTPLSLPHKCISAIQAALESGAISSQDATTYTRRATKY